jgi:hypothetical protein
VIVDGHNPLLWKESVMAFLRRAGLAVEIGLEHVVFEDRDPVSLLIIRRPWEREACYPLHEWSHRKEVHRESILFESGSELLGWEILRPPLLSGRVVLHTYWRCAQPAHIVVVSSEGLALANSAIAPDITNPDSMNTIIVSSMELSSNDCPRLFLFDPSQTQRRRPLGLETKLLDPSGAVVLLP